jgi:hypothetical protein
MIYTFKRRPQKFEYKAEGYGKQWDPTTSITAYFTGLYKF